MLKWPVAPSPVPEMWHFRNLESVVMKITLMASDNSDILTREVNQELHL